MQTIHIFNPEHDMALAYDDEFFTAPHAGRAMRADLSFLPVFWAEDGDFVVVDNVEQALEKVRHFKRKLPRVTYITLQQVQHLTSQQVAIDVWGWDSAVCRQLLRQGCPSTWMPSPEVLAQLRILSHRKWAAEVLLELRQELDFTVGDAFFFSDITQLVQAMQEGDAWVLKAPWSCSGRGIRYVTHLMPPQVEAWAAKVIRQQGGIMLEPQYNKVKDFGMEFYADGAGNVTYLGLSLFHTEGGAYAGNLLATEDDKLAIMERYVSIERLGEVASKISKCLSARLRNLYKGPLGVDMMIVASADGSAPFMLHPCVEINLRRTMGHVALSLSPSAYELQQLMQIDYDGHYHLKISNIQTNNSTNR